MVHKMQRLTMNNSTIIAKKEQSYPAILEDSEGVDEGEGIHIYLFLIPMAEKYLFAINGYW